MSGSGRDPAERERQRHGSVFGIRAAAYAEHRPDYPDAAVTWALAPLRGRPGSARPGGGLRVVDLGAGTGKLTGTLARHTGRVLALEPDPAMLAELRRAVPGSLPVLARAEQLPLPDASVDAVLAAQSAHWFDLPLAMPEIARVLRPGGVLAGLWNTDDDRVGWVAGLAAVMPGLASVPLSRWREQGGDPLSRWLAGAPDAGFGPASRAEFGHWQQRTADSLVATIATHSTVLLMDPAGRAAALAAVREFLAGQPETAAGPFRLPMVTSVMRAVRRRP
ncbi:MAG: class I SAM-dependent methyltransferase [Gemmatimonadota bacterium]